MAPVLVQVRNGNPISDGLFAGMNHLLRNSDHAASGISALPRPKWPAGVHSSSFLPPFFLPEMFTNTKHRQRGAAFGIAKTGNVEPHQDASGGDAPILTTPHDHTWKSPKRESPMEEDVIA